MNISEQLLAIPQRETAGEDSDDAFAFQKSWALYSILNSHLSGQEYLYIFEYHDDVLRLDSENPKSIEFIQIKKSDKNSWTIVRLTKQHEDGGGKSIIGKLYSHVINFPDASIKLRFVSDMHFNFSNEKFFCAISVKQEDQELLLKKVKQELPILQCPDLNILWFEKCVLSFDAHAEQLLGAVEKFIVSVFGNQAKIRATTLQDILLRRLERSRYPSCRVQTFDELKSKKGLGRSEIETLIHDLKENETYGVTWEEIIYYVSQLVISERDRLMYRGEFIRLSNRIKINPDDVILSIITTGRKAFAQSSIEDNANAIISHFRNYLRLTSPEFVSCFTSKQTAIIGLITYCESMMAKTEELV